MPSHHSPSTTHDDIQLIPKEDRMQAVIAAIEARGYKSNGDPILSLRSAASIWKVARSTLAARLNGVQSRSEAHSGEQLLTPNQEEILVKWTKVMGRRGIPLTHATLRQYASEISEKPVGESWSKRFLSRHPDLKVKATTSLEKCRAKALNRTAVDGFYDLLREVVEEFNICHEDIYNMDEKGIQLGIGAKVAGIVDRDQANVYSVEDGNRELVTTIETVCADGSYLTPSVIFQGVRRNPEWGRAGNNPSQARYALSNFRD